ncbi:MAG: chlP [Cyanobacteria bacterium RYN_339]|nr:chlP [Cyanobacteria bacterium RYN_339]
MEAPLLHVVVVGGGPAGLIAAEATARAGIKTTLIERAPERNRPCAGLLSSTFLEEFQVPELLLAQKVQEIALCSPTQRMAFVNLSGVNRWAGVIRRELLTTLFRRRAEEAGVTFMHGTFMRFRHADGDYPLLEVRLPGGEREQLQADVVIGADGVHSRVARAIRLPALELGVVYQERYGYPEGAKAPDGMQLHLGRKVSTDTFAWSLPEGDQLLLGVATATKYGRRVWDMLGELKKRLGSQLDGAKPLGREAFCYPRAAREKLAHDRVLLVGDAAGLVAPGVLDGLYYACKSAQLAAAAVVRHQHVPLPERLAEYEQDWKQEYGELFAAHARMEKTFFGADREREALVDMAWDRDVQRVAVEAYLTKKRFTLPFRLKLRMKTRMVSQLVKYRVINPKKLETDMVARAMPAPRNYLDLALETPDELACVVPEATQHVEI